MKKTFFILIIISLLSCKEKTTDELLKDDRVSFIIGTIEEAYFEGQKDALEGDIRIKMNRDSTGYEWIKSPWDDTDEPLVFDPKPEPIPIDL